MNNFTNDVKDILMKRDNMSEEEALDLIEEANEAFDDYMCEGDIDSAMDICAEYFGLEPDYLNI